MGSSSTAYTGQAVNACNPGRSRGQGHHQLSSELEPVRGLHETLPQRKGNKTLGGVAMNPYPHCLCTASQLFLQGCTYGNPIKLLWILRF